MIERHDTPARLTVTVIDRQRMDQLWGTPAFRGVVKRTISIKRHCPVCGKPRGEIKRGLFHEFGEHYSVDVWTNPCGHVDKYVAVLAEARQLEEGKH